MSGSTDQAGLDVAAQANPFFKMNIKSRLSDIKVFLALLKEAFLDCLLFYRAALRRNHSQDERAARLEGAIIRHYHVIEKGLTMPEFKFGSSRNMVAGLIGLLERYEREPVSVKESISKDQIRAAECALQEYRERHQEHGYDVADLFRRFGKDSVQETKSGGSKNSVVKVRPSEEADVFFEFLKSRVSVRTFLPGHSPSEEMLWRIAEIANTAPSVCNRQTSRLHFFVGEQAQKVLSHQGGNRGFGHTIPSVAIVTSDQRYFHGVAERNQGWIDGGMFAMQTLLAIHCFGLGAVPLNWSVLNEQDRRLKRETGIPDYERIIMLIGFGFPSDQSVPFSNRKPCTSIAHIHE